MPHRPIVPRKVEHNGRPCWRVIVPQDIDTDKRKRYFPVDEHKSGKSVTDRGLNAAKLFCEQLKAIRDDRQIGFGSIGAEERGLLYAAYKEAGMSAQFVLESIRFRKLHQPDLNPPLTEVVAEFLKSRERKSKAYRGPLQVRMRNFARTFGHRTASDIQASDIRDWLNAQTEWKEETVNSMLKDLRTLFSFAIDSKYATMNPAKAVPKEEVSRKPPGIFTVEEAERLMRTIERVDPGLIPYVALILFGGLRPQEAHRTCESHFHGDIIDLPAGATKLDHRRLIELKDVPTCWEWLKRGGDWKPINLRKRMDRIRAEAVNRNENGGEFIGPLRLPWSNDVLRHSFVSYSVPIHGVTQTALMADHSEAVLKQHYRELVRKADAEKFWEIKPI